MSTSNSFSPLSKEDLELSRLEDVESLRDRLVSLRFRPETTSSILKLCCSLEELWKLVDSDFDAVFDTKDICERRLVIQRLRRARAAGPYKRARSPHAAPEASALASANAEFLWVYVLECEDGCVYVGLAKDANVRFEFHQWGTAAAWTRLHPPLGFLVEPRSVPRLHAGLEEDFETKKWMLQRGVEFVRGGTYTQPTLPPASVDALKAELYHNQGLCTRCGRSGHFISTCHANTRVSGSPLPCRHRGGSSSSSGAEAPLAPVTADGSSGDCSRCGYAGHLEENCHARHDFQGKDLRCVTKYARFGRTSHFFDSCNAFTTKCGVRLPLRNIANSRGKSDDSASSAIQEVHKQTFLYPTPAAAFLKACDTELPEGMEEKVKNCNHCDVDISHLDDSTCYTCFCKILSGTTLI